MSLFSRWSFNPKGFHMCSSFMMLDFVYISFQIQGGFFLLAAEGEKSIGRIMMLLSLLLPRLYIHCHQFTTQPLDLNLGFYSSALLFICNSCRCVGEKTCVCSTCVLFAWVCVCVCVCVLLELQKPQGIVRTGRRRSCWKSREVVLKEITEEGKRFFVVVFSGISWQAVSAQHGCEEEQHRELRLVGEVWLLVLLLASLHNDGKRGNVLTPRRR